MLLLEQDKTFTHPHEVNEFDKILQQNEYYT